MDKTNSHIIKKDILKKDSLWTSFKNGSIYVKLSALLMSLGYFKRKQFFQAILYTVFQAVFIIFLISFGIPALSKISTLGTIEYSQVYDPDLGKNVVNNYDNSFLILLFSLITLVVSVFFIVIWVKNIKLQYQLELVEKSGKKLPTIKEELSKYLDEKFHITLLSIPILGIVVFTIIPLLFMFLVGFTNFDTNHQPPMKLFTWVGLTNFKTLLALGSGGNFSYAFGKIMLWTLIWAFLATITTYIGGILLAMFINSRDVKAKKVWRTIFVVTIAVPQFVSLLLVKNFFANQGIVNTIANNLGIVKMLQDAGLVRQGLNYIPFLTDPMWTKAMLIMINVWIGVPYVMLITTGVLMNIPKDLYESATIDGASKFKLFTKITMPYMLFVTAPYLITSFIHNMNNFNVIYLLTYDRGTTDLRLASVDARDVDLLVTWLFRLTSEKSNFKMASVIGMVLFLVSVVFTLIAFNYTIRSGKEDKFQ